MVETNWNLAAAIYQLGESPLAERPALVHGELVISFAELRRRSLGVAAWLTDNGLPQGSHVGHLLRNSNAYMEAFFGTGLAGMRHLNINYRYREQELIDICHSLEVAVLVYDAEFSDRVSLVAEALGEDMLFVQVGESNAPHPYELLENLYDCAGDDFQPSTTGDDIVLIATGGTTGSPKGVMWKHEDLWHKLKISTGNTLGKLKLEHPPQDMAEHVANCVRRGEPPALMPLSPLMHGAGLFTALSSIAQGATLVTVPGAVFEADTTLDLLKKHRVGCLTLVGDAFALPLLEALERRRDEELLASLRLLISTGASLSDDCKAAFLSHHPGLHISDTLGSSEAMAMAVSTPEAGVFRPLPGTRILDEDLNDVVPGSDEIGIAYTTGHVPQGYFKSPEKSAITFPLIDGVRYVNTGDRCMVREDGMLILLGRDSTVINTGGEKVYTVEVERVLLSYPAVTDALVVGLPHPRFGRMVTAVVQGPGLTADNLDVDDVLKHAGLALADYKLPRKIFVIDDLQRAANGKPDYPFITSYAEQKMQKA